MERNIKVVVKARGIRSALRSAIDPWWKDPMRLDMWRAHKKLEALVAKWIGQVGESPRRDIPSGPDTSKFFAPSYGYLKVFSNWEDQQLAMGIKIGTSYGSRGDQKKIMEEATAILMDLKNQWDGFIRQDEGTAYGYIGWGRKSEADDPARSPELMRGGYLRLE